MPGAAFAATSTRTQSWNDAASTTSVPKRSHAHLIALDAGLRSSSADTAASSRQVDVDRRPIGRSLQDTRLPTLTHVAAHSPSPTSAT